MLDIPGTPGWLFIDVRRHQGDEIGRFADAVVVENLSHRVVVLGRLGPAVFDLVHGNVVFLKHVCDLCRACILALYNFILPAMQLVNSSSGAVGIRRHHRLPGASGLAQE